MGKIVQGIKDIFRRRETNIPAQNNITFSELTKVDEEILKESLRVTIDMLLDKQDLITDSWKKSLSPSAQHLLVDINKELEFLSNTHRTNLPKPIEFPCAKVLVSSHFSKEYEAIIFDMSQYEEKKIAHIISYSPERIEEYFKEEELTPEEIEDQCMIALLPGGKVLYYEENDEWDYCFY